MGKTVIEWVNKADRLPIESDADDWGCVLVWHIYNGCQILGWNNPRVHDSSLITHWAQLPKDPNKAKECKDGKEEDKA